MSDCTRIYLVRHGDVEERYHQVFGGKLEMELSPKGHSQAQSLGGFFKDKVIDSYYCSPMIRTRQTFAPIADAKGGIEPTIESDFREVDFGDWTGLTWSEVEEKYETDAHLWLQWLTDGKIPNAERITDYQERIERGLKTLAEKEKGKSVLIMCHGGVIRMLLSLMLGIPMRHMGGVEIEYASVSTVDYREPGSRARLISYAPWRTL